jgi:ADP-ribose pyrophosphatase YjhB (NUDIX family)
MVKMEVAALVFITSEEGLLLVEQDYGRRYWSLPGGLVEANETIEQAAIREVKEETGLDVHLIRTIGVYRKYDRDGLAITFKAEVIGGELEAGAEISECRYFSFDKLPTHARGHFIQRVDDFLLADNGIVYREQ